MLIGLRSKSKQKSYHYRTLWIASKKGKVLVRETKDILVPRKKGFWKVGVVTIRKKRDDSHIDLEFIPIWYKDIPWSVPLGKSPAINEINELKELYYEELITILFVGNDYISMEVSYYDSGGAHPNMYFSLMFLQLDDSISDLNFKDPSLKISKVLGNKAKQAVNHGVKNFIKNHDEICPCFDVELTTWGLVRQRGKWVLRAQLYNPNISPCRSCVENFSIKFKLPKSLVGHDKLMFSWNRIKKKIPDANDAISSPKDDLLIVLTKKELLIFQPKNNQMGEPVKKLTLKNKESVVMIQWALGRNVDRWDKVIQKAK